MQAKHYCEVNYSLLTISPQSLCQFCSLHNDVRQLLHTKCYQQIQVSTEASPVVKCLYTKPSDPRVKVEPICTNYSLPKSSKLKPSDIVSNLLLSPRKPSPQVMDPLGVLFHENPRSFQCLLLGKVTSDSSPVYLNSEKSQLLNLRG